mmetsp:Transcript_3514/g.8282  ORF Transcript_3514/g.8282 Transcript_3514/m.8282 type:complete len:206 (-) Transcript_3514:655-1272(-)
MVATAVVVVETLGALPAPCVPPPAAASGRSPAPPPHPSTGRLLTASTTKCTVVSFDHRRPSETRNRTESYPCHSGEGAYVRVPILGAPTAVGSSLTSVKAPCSGDCVTEKLRLRRCVWTSKASSVTVTPSPSRMLYGGTHPPPDVPLVPLPPPVVVALVALMETPAPVVALVVFVPFCGAMVLQLGAKPEVPNARGAVLRMSSQS